MKKRRGSAFVFAFIDGRFFLFISCCSFICDACRYTSVGNRSNTQANPALRIADPLTGREQYRPAYLLDDCMTERHGRL